MVWKSQLVYSLLTWTSHGVQLDSQLKSAIKPAKRLSQQISFVPQKRIKMLQSTNKYNTVTEWLHTSKWHFIKRRSGDHGLPLAPPPCAGRRSALFIWGACHLSFRQPMSALIPLYSPAVSSCSERTAYYRLQMRERRTGLWRRERARDSIVTESARKEREALRAVVVRRLCVAIMFLFCRYKIIYIQSWLAYTVDTLMSRLISIDIWYLFFTCKSFRRRNHGKYASVWCSYDLRKTTVRRTVVNNSVWTFRSNKASFYIFLRVRFIEFVVSRCNRAIH